MENNNEKFWMSIIKKYENRKLLLQEQQCNLEQRLGSLKRRLSSRSQNDVCSCCSLCFEATPASSQMNTTNSTSCCPTGTFDDLSNVSLNSMDMQYIAILNELINGEKQLKKQVRDMEMCEQDLLKHTDQTFGSIKKSCCDANEERDPTTYGNDTQKLLDDNARLSDELEDVKLELKHCMEKFHGPLARTLDQERRRSQQLENDLKAANETMATKECCYREDMCCLKNHLAEVTQNLADMSRQNENLQRQSCSLGRKYKDLQRDLISQKLNEARTLERLNELLSEKERTVVRDRRQQKSQETQNEFDLQIIPQKEEKGKADAPRPPLEYNLYAIARSLSKTLLNINKCDICRDSIPGDLKETITGIKVITDIVDHGNPKNENANLSDSKKPPDTGPDNGQSKSLPKGFHGSKTDASGKTEDDSYYGDTGKNDAIEDITDATDISTDASMPEEMNDGCEAVKEICFVKTPPNESIHVLTEVEALDELQVQVDTQVELSEEIMDDIHVTTTVTNSGMLEVITEGPAGIIETTMIRTPSGNFEVVTEITEYPEYLSITESGDTYHDLDNIVTDIEVKELEQVDKVGDFVDSVNETLEEEEFFSLREMDMSEGADFNKPDNLEIETMVAFVQCVEYDHRIMDIHNRGKLEKSLLTPIMEDEEAKSDEKLDVVEQSSILHEFSDNDVERPKSVLPSFAETENTQELSLSSSVTEEVVLEMEKIGSPGRIPYVTSDNITSDRSKSGGLKSRKKNRKTFMSKIPASASFPYQGPICNCGTCGCLECFGRIIPEPQHGEADGLQPESCAPNKFGNLPNEVSSVVSARQKKSHPPDCDCVDCLCDPCASFPPDYATRVHPPGCDCVDCLCDDFPCATQCTEQEIGPSEKSITEPSEQFLSDNGVSEYLSLYKANKISEPVLDKTSTKKIEENFVSPTEPVKNPTPINEISKNLANEISEQVLDQTPRKEIDENIVSKTEPVKNPIPINEISENLAVSTLTKAISENGVPDNELSGKLHHALGEGENHQEGCECGSCDCCKCNKIRSPASDRCEVTCGTNDHLPNCSCIECLLVCGIPNQTKEKQETVASELSTVSNIPSDGSSCDCAECNDTCTSPNCGQIKEIMPVDNRKAELRELQVCLDKIKCACLEAEATACSNRVEMKGSGQNLLETLKGIIVNLQSKCTGKSMADIANELKAKVNSVLYEKLLPKLISSLNLSDIQVARQEIYSCACMGEKKDKNGVYLPNTCSCGIKTDNKNISRDSSSCSCLDIDDESDNVLPCSQSDESCHFVKLPGKDLQVNLSEFPVRKTPSVALSLCSCTSCEELKPQLICKQDTANSNSSPMDITEVRKVSSDGLLIKWLPSTRKDVTGYEILIDGKTKSKVHSALRTSAIIYSVANGSLNLSVYAITPRGRCQPPANAMYEF